MRSILALYLAELSLAGAFASHSALTSFHSFVVPVNMTLLTSGAPTVLQPYVSYSIELCYFPDYAGMDFGDCDNFLNSALFCRPNTFSNQLLDNLGDIQGVKPYIRVGGNTQDYALYNVSLEHAINGTINPSKSVDYPTTLYIGPSFFESYSTWPNTKFIHGFNLAKNGSEALQSLLDTVPMACRVLQNEKLAYWELGNEPDLYKTSSQGIVRPANWTEQDYVHEWLIKSNNIRQALAQACPESAMKQNYRYIAPSFAGVSNSLNPITTWKDGLNADGSIALTSQHNYVGGATSPGVTLQGTLMNHTRVVQDVYSLTNLSKSLAADGAPGLSNSFGAALWGVDFNLYAASQGIRRQHMHQGTDYRYASWQPIETEKTTIGTKAPYYGNIFVAEMVRGGPNVQITNLPLSSSTEGAYAAYVNGTLARIAVVNLMEYNYTIADLTNKIPIRPSASYTFQTLPGPQSFSVRRLIANGSDAITGITWDGYSYNYELDGGRPVRLSNVTIGEKAHVDGNGVVSIDIPYSSAAILTVD